MDAITNIHASLANTVWLFLLILGLWSLWRSFRGQGVSGGFLGALAIGEILIVVQVILGAILYFSGGDANLTQPALHVLYAAFSVVFLPFVYLYWLRGDDSNRAQWVLTFSVLFQFGTIFYRFGPLATFQ